MSKTKSVLFYLACPLVMAGSFAIGRKTAKPTVRTLGDLNAVVGGKRVYLIDADIKCTNGKSLGKLQVDLDLTNGKLHVVRNDAGKEPSCVN